MGDWQKAPPTVPDPPPKDFWWTRFSVTAFDWSAWRQEREANQARLRNLGQRYDPLGKKTDDYASDERRRRRRD